MQECKENLERLLRQAASMVSTSVKDSELPGGNSHGSSIVLLNSGDSFAEIFVRTDCSFVLPQISPETMTENLTALNSSMAAVFHLENWVLEGR